MGLPLPKAHACRLPAGANANVENVGFASIRRAVANFAGGYDPQIAEAVSFVEERVAAISDVEG